MDTTQNSETDPQTIIIKEEFSPTIKEEQCNIQIKMEDDDATAVNLYDDKVQIEDEVTTSIEQDDSRTNTEVNIKEESEMILPTMGDDIKQEKDGEDYDYRHIEDSMDSSEAVALCQVEACLDDVYNIKTENDDETVYPAVVKSEPELTVTETHIISNKLINTTSTITNTLDGIIESQTTKTFVMEILPVTQNHAMKMSNPEEILPTTTNMYKMECNEPFQLNSITGNVLSLEQEAYDIFETKKKGKTDLKEPVTCPKCPKSYIRKYEMIRHMKVHDTIERREMGVIKGKKTRIENQIKKMAEYDADNEECVVKKEPKEGYDCTCGKVFKRRSRMETCLRSHSDVSDASTYAYTCSTCDKKFKTKELLIFHRNRQHRKKFPCKFCPTDYQTQKELFKHLQDHQKVQLIEYKVMSEFAKGDQQLQCLLCTKTCSKLSDYKTHVMEEHKEPYKCPHCDHAFTKINDFASHIKKTHVDAGNESVLDVLEAFSKLAKAWKCEDCGKQFHKADKLALHQVEEHSPDMKNEQHFQCEDCQRVFVSNQGLNSHRRMHHRTESTDETEPAEVGVMCLECRKMCADMNALTSHMRLHSMERKYPCKYCDFRFTTPQKRKVHAEIHTGDMKYVCFICEYQCSSENRLKRHKMSIKHLNMKEYLLTGKPLIEEEQSTSKEEKIKDTLRNSEWGVKKKKRKHKVDVECDICGEKFSSDSDMQEHKQTHPFIEFPNDDKPSRIFFK